MNYYHGHNENEEEVPLHLNVIPQVVRPSLFLDQCVQLEANDEALTVLDMSVHIDNSKALKLSKCLLGNTCLKELNVMISRNLTQRGEQALAGGIHGSAINRLSLYGNHELRLDMTQLYKDSITELAFNFPIGDHFAARAPAFLKGNKSLERLTIGIGDDMTPRGARLLSRGIRGCNIKSLVMFGPASTETVETICLEGIKKSSTIQGLVVLGIPGAVHALVPTLPVLQDLHISAVALSLLEIQALCTGLAKAPTMNALQLVNCNLGDKHIGMLSLALGLHGFLMSFDVRQNSITDEGIESFFECCGDDLTIMKLRLDQNKIGPAGARLIIQAVYDQVAICILHLSHNQAIGYDGLKAIGEELSGKIVLDLDYVVSWTDFDDKECADAIAQETKRAKASESLLAGVRGNMFIQHLSVEGLNLPSKVTAELALYTEANRGSRTLLLEQNELPVAFWSHFLAKQQNNSSLMFLFLRELPVLLKEQGKKGRKMPSKPTSNKRPNTNAKGRSRSAVRKLE